MGKLLTLYIPDSQTEKLGLNNLTDEELRQRIKAVVASSLGLDAVVAYTIHNE